MDKKSQPAVPDVPEADAVEQEYPATLESDDDLVTDALDVDANEADFIEQHTPLVPRGSQGIPDVDPLEADANEADLIEQATGLPGDGEDDYPNSAGAPSYPEQPEGD